MGFKRIIRKIQSELQFDIVKETEKIILLNEEIILDLLRVQLSQGKDSEGKPVTIYGRAYYSDLTIQNKYFSGVGLGRETEWITNYMSGRFYGSLRLDVRGEVFDITSDVPYFTAIVARSGRIIMKLNREHLQFFSDSILKPQLKERFEKHVNGL